MRIANVTEKMNMVAGALVAPMVNLVTRTTNVGVNKDFKDTELLQAFDVNVNAAGFNLPEGVPEGVVKSWIAATASYLSMMKEANKDVATALVLIDTEGQFKFAGIVKYNANEENPDEPGNWDFTMTFDEQDVKDLEEERTVKKFYYSDDSFKNVYDKVGYDVGGIEFKHDRYMYDSAIILIDTIKQILDKEAIPGEQVDLEIPGFATFTVGVENDEKIMVATPDGQMKAIVKGDAELEQ